MKILKYALIAVAGLVVLAVAGAVVFAMTFDDSQWVLSREDPDMFQRFIADMGPQRIAGRWEASEDHGNTWRKDFDLIFERA